jgi:hypothetical protein
VKSFKEAVDSLTSRDATFEEALSDNLREKAREKLDDLKSRTRELREEISNSPEVATLISTALIRVLTARDEDDIRTGMYSVFFYGVMTGIEMERWDGGISE